MEGWFSRQWLLSGVVVTVVVGFVLDGWDVADLAVEAGVVLPPHPVEVNDACGRATRKAGHVRSSPVSKDFPERRHVRAWCTASLRSGSSLWPVG